MRNVQCQLPGRLQQLVLGRQRIHQAQLGGLVGVDLRACRALRLCQAHTNMFRCSAVVNTAKEVESHTALWMPQAGLRDAITHICAARKSAGS